jgi:CRISPR-associated protein Cmr3
MFKYLISIDPLGFLYGSSGRFLSPENLVGRSGTNFPPSAATLSGLFASSLDKTEIADLRLAGPFWAEIDKLDNFYVPTPLHYSVKKDSYKEDSYKEDRYKIEYSLHYDSAKQKWLPVTNESKKPDKGTWLAIDDWEKPTGESIKSAPWKYSPHLHPRLAKDQRRVYIADEDDNLGSLFLENAVEMHSETCLVYLSTLELPDGWYRFGGEGHMVDLKCTKLTETMKITQLLNKKVNDFFATITPGVWGSNRLSTRYPPQWEDEIYEAMITDRPTPFRYRLGQRLSRGRYAVPAGSVYKTKSKLLLPWWEWDESWFPSEKFSSAVTYSYKRWGCGLALPLPVQSIS